MLSHVQRHQTNFWGFAWQIPYLPRIPLCFQLEGGPVRVARWRHSALIWKGQHILFTTLAQNLEDSITLIQHATSKQTVTYKNRARPFQTNLVPSSGRSGIFRGGKVNS